MKCVTPSGRPSTTTVSVGVGVALLTGGLLVLLWPEVRGDGPLRRFGSFLSRFWTPPSVSFLGQLPSLLLETLLIAFVASVFAASLSFLAAFLAARTTTPHPVVMLATRAVASVLRALPDLVLALILAGSLGLGPVPGVIALALASIGFLTKGYAECLEVVDRGPVEGVLATGADWLAVRSIGVLPQASRDLVGLTLYQLDSNVRSSAILGIVGAGGIGYPLTRSVQLFQFDRLGVIILSIYLLVTAIDRLSDWMRKVSS